MCFSILAGLLKVDGSANYLFSDLPKVNEESVTYEYTMTSHSYTLNNNARMDNNKYCGDESTATHFVTSITYGRHIRLNLKRPVMESENKETVNRRLHDLIKKIPSMVQAKAAVLSDEDKQLPQVCFVFVF